MHTHLDIHETHCMQDAEYDFQEQRRVHDLALVKDAIELDDRGSPAPRLAECVCFGRSDGVGEAHQPRQRAVRLRSERAHLRQDVREQRGATAISQL